MWAAIAYVTDAHKNTTDAWMLVYVLLAYYFAGICGGLLVGVLLPLTRTTPGAMLVGSLVAIMLFLSMQMTQKGPIWLWDGRTWWQTALLAVVFGVVLGPAIASNARRS